MIELVVTIAIAGILLAVAMPNLQNFIAGRAVAAQSEDLIGALRYARSEAIKRGGAVTICRTTAATPAVCATSPSGTWQYWMVFAEMQTTGDTLGKLDSDEIPLRVMQAPAGKVNYDTSTPVYYSFQATGIVFTDSTAATTQPIVTMTPNISSTSSSYARYERQVCLNKVGRAQLVDGTGSCSS
jgi:Tfp pilus assembly protein FimT